MSRNRSGQGGKNRHSTRHIRQGRPVSFHTSDSRESPIPPLSLPEYGDAQPLEPLLTHILRQANRPLGMDELLRISKLPRKAKKSVESALYSLQEQGLALRGGTGWSSPARLRQVEGVLSVQRAGMGFVAPASGNGPDIYIHPAAMNGAWHGDQVEVLILPGRRGPSPEGRVTKIVRRALRELPVHALRVERDGKWLSAPESPRIQALFLTDVSGLEKEVREHDLLLVRPGEQIGPNFWQAEATLNLEREETPAAQERLVKSSYDIPDAFPQAVLEVVRAAPQNPRESDFAGRRDLRGCDFVTIDGRRARDFDDAVQVESTPAGYRLRVAIADVSHYVRQNSPLDAEARLRGNSFYFPLSVAPMLPEALSNGLCSLKPDVPRLVMAADMLFSEQGQRRGAEFYPAVIVSKARLTYGQIERGLLLREKEEEERLAPVLPMLEQAEKLARILAALRRERGSLDFDLPEAEALFDEQGEIVGLAPRRRHFGHRLIEEFMIAANEAVAEFLQKQGQGALYRVHEAPDPDKLASLVDFLAASGLEHGLLPRGGRRGARKMPTARDLVRLLDEVRETPREYTVNRLLLRAMMQARYQPDNDGHFGLASACYCHFTSPIRRYADLVNHRALKQALGLQSGAGGNPFSDAGREGAPALQAEEKPLTRARLEALAEHINDTERTAAEAEREMDKRLAVLFLRHRVGEEFDGVVSGLGEFGIFVELPSVMAEGMIRLSTLMDDYYQYVPEKQELRGAGTRRTFRLGQPLRVLLVDARLQRLEITLALAGEGADAREKPARKKAGKAKRPASARKEPRKRRA